MCPIKVASLSSLNSMKKINNTIFKKISNTILKVMIIKTIDAAKLKRILTKRAMTTRSPEIIIQDGRSQVAVSLFICLKLATQNDNFRDMMKLLQFSTIHTQENNLKFDMIGI